HDVLDGRFGGKLDRSVGETKPFGAETDLRDRFLAGNVDRAVAGAGERGRYLDEQGGFTDAGIAAQQQDGAAHKSATGDAVKFCPAGGEARGRPRFALLRFQRKQATLTGGAPRS